MIRNNIKELAKDLIETSAVLKGELEDIINDVTTPELNSLKAVLSAIVEQKYDMTGFVIDNVTDQGVYSFYDGASKYFEICIVNNNAVISYPEPITTGSTNSREKVVNTIDAAVIGASVWLKNCKLSLG